jgi:hypothetical protein
LRHWQPIFFQKVAPEIKQPGIGEPRHGHQPSVHSIICEQYREMLRGPVRCHRRRQIQQIGGENARTHHVDLKHVDVGRACSEKLLKQCQSFVGVIGRGDHTDDVASARSPPLRTLSTEFEFDTNGAASDGDIGRSCPVERHAAE